MILLQLTNRRVKFHPAFHAQTMNSEVWMPPTAALGCFPRFQTGHRQCMLTVTMTCPPKTDPKQSCGNVDFSVPNDAHYRPDPWLTRLDQELKLVPTSAT